MSTTNNLIRRISKQNDEYKELDGETTKGSLTRRISQDECQLLQQRLMDDSALPQACKFFAQHVNSAAETVEAVKPAPTVRRRQTFVEMHDYPPTMC